MKKQLKKKSPFRIKIGSVVALRYRQSGGRVAITSSLKNKPSLQPASYFYAGSSVPFADCWCHPKPGFDEGLALVGCRVRCSFPNLVMSKLFHNRKAATRILEGEIVSIVDFEAQFREQRKSRRRRESRGTLVELLISKDRLEAMPFLNDLRCDVDIDTSKLSESARRNYINEERVRGEGKCVVRITLVDSSGIVVDCHPKRLEARWVIRKRVPLNMLQQFCTINDATLHEDKISSGPFGENTQTRGRKKNDGFDSSPVERQKKRPKIVDCSAKYLGDGNDIESQQEANWRWQSTRYNPYTSLKTLPLKFGFLSCLLSRFVGEVVRIQPGDSDSKTLAVVTCKRLILPEHTEWGRSSSHLPNEIYEDFDSFSAANGVIATNDKSQQPISYFCFPIEDLVTVSRQLDNILTTKAQNVILRHKLILTRAYSLRVNMFADVQNSGINTVDIKTQLCCRCRKPRNKGGQKTSNGRSLCYTCFYALKIMVPEGTRQNNKSKITCECRQCKRNVEPEKEMQFFKSVSRASERKKHLPSEKLQQKLLNNTTEFMSTCATLECMNNVDFHILDDLLPRMVPSSKPVMRVKKKSSKKSEKSSNSYSLATSHGERETSSLRSLYKHQYLMQAKEQVPETCCRAFPYNNQTRKLDIFKKRNIQCQHAYLESKDRKRNLRSLIREGTASYLDYKKKQGGIYDSRRLRANQRRLLRDVAAMGVSLDTLAGREQHLRFDRSKIHAWGVFADIDIRENEMLVEYRGEIIGNSMSEKREKEYENAKIGSDYMFRVDDFSVCDATKQGNVARFINHSCGPNCFTKIISIEGVKRIVLYAKRDIVAGEELSYDYKFPLEYNEKKRISCHCGSHDCRGYMNWDKKYVELSNNEAEQGAIPSSK